MDHFSLDNVRDSFAADVAAQIRRVHEAGQALLGSDSLATPVAIDPVDKIPGFDAISHACHAIFGTSALVSARSMAESARLLEILTTVGKDALAEIERNGRIGRSLGEACVEGAQALARMLELELDHRNEEAWEVALQFRERMGRWEEARDAIAQGEPPREFAFEDAPGPPPAPLVLGPEEFSFEEEKRGLSPHSLPTPASSPSKRAALTSAPDATTRSASSCSRSSGRRPARAWSSWSRTCGAWPWTRKTRKPWARWRRSTTR